jgi:hypothetical protein
MSGSSRGLKLFLAAPKQLRLKLTAMICDAIFLLPVMAVLIK